MQTGTKRRLDYNDYLAIPDDGKRYEIIGGVLYVTPSPSPLHQRVSQRLEQVLIAYFHGQALGEVFHAPIDLLLAAHDIVQPDILIVGDAGLVTERGIEGPPLLVVEILSPSTKSRDRGVKSRRYAELGVEHYWLVDPTGRRVEFHRLSGETYRRIAEATGVGQLTHPEWDGLVLDLTALWR